MVKNKLLKIIREYPFGTFLWIAIPAYTAFVMFNSVKKFNEYKKSIEPFTTKKHVVRAGETTLGIADKYDLIPEKIKRYRWKNNIMTEYNLGKDLDEIYPKDTLRYPVFTEKKAKEIDPDGDDYF